MSYLLIKAPNRPTPATANLMPLLLGYLNKRGSGLNWKIINADVVLKQGNLISEFKEQIINILRWDDLILILGKIDSLIEITLISADFDMDLSDINNLIYKRDFSQLDILIDFFDSSEWIFFSSIENEMKVAFRHLATELPRLEIEMRP